MIKPPQSSRRVRGLALAFALIAGTCLPVGAQTVTADQDLAFGDVFPGVPKTIEKTSASAAEFTVTGTVDAEVTIDFDLPGYLYTTGANMPVYFYETDCAVDTTNPPDQSSPSLDDQNPYSTITYRIGSSGQMKIWLGGQLMPGLTQKSGDYTAPIRVTVSYTGN
jgi:hypothetical protein